MIFSALLQDTDFRERIITELNKSDQEIEYIIPNKIPCLCRYRSISKYSVDDIVNNSLTLSAASEYNDIFDSTMCIFSNDEELDALVDKDLEGLSAIGGNNNYFRNKSKIIYQKEAELKKNTVNYLGAHFCCFSTIDSSILMWAHYANNNTGLCLKYDTNGDNDLFKKYAFPVAYRSKPVNVAQLLFDKSEKNQHGIELAVMLSVLCKFEIWSYEQEWRLISPLLPDDEGKPRFNLINVPRIKEIIFGTHFLKNCFGDNSEEGINNLNRIISYANEKDIPLFIVLPDIGRFNLTKHKLDKLKLDKFFDREINGKKKNILQYGTIKRIFLKELCGFIL